MNFTDLHICTLPTLTITTINAIERHFLYTANNVPSIWISAVKESFLLLSSDSAAACDTSVAAAAGRWRTYAYVAGACARVARSNEASAASAAGPAGTWPAAACAAPPTAATAPSAVASQSTPPPSPPESVSRKSETETPRTQDARASKAQRTAWGLPAIRLATRIRTPTSLVYKLWVPRTEPRRLQALARSGPYEAGEVCWAGPRALAPARAAAARPGAPKTGTRSRVTGRPPPGRSPAPTETCSTGFPQNKYLKTKQTRVRQTMLTPRVVTRLADTESSSRKLFIALNNIPITSKTALKANTYINKRREKRLALIRQRLKEPI